MAIPYSLFKDIYIYIKERNEKNGRVRGTNKSDKKNVLITSRLRTQGAQRPAGSETEWNKVQPANGPNGSE